jgi:hypothetical protein
MNLTERDFDAMTRAIAAARGESRGRARQIDDKLRRESFEAVGRFAAFTAQIASLNLEPWESTPLYADCPESRAMLQKMLALGLSRYEPDPLQAIAEAERRQATTRWDR